ncbi:MAG: hypothetical protein AAGE52_07490 [Myxococcota bacterium]
MALYTEARTGSPVNPRWLGLVAMVALGCSARASGPTQIYVHGSAQAQQTIRRTLERGLTAGPAIEAPNAPLQTAVEADLEGFNAPYHVHVDGSDPRAIHAIFLFGRPPRVYVQTLRDEVGFSVVQLESLVQLVDTVLTDVPLDGSFGVAAEEAEDELAAVGVVAPSSPTGFVFALGAVMAQHAERLVRGGGSLSGGFRLTPGHLALDLGVDVEAATAEERSNAASTRLVMISPVAFLELRRRLGAVSLGGRLSGGASFLHARAQPRAGFVGLGGAWDAEAVIRAELALRLSPHRRISVGLRPGLEIAPSPVEYIVEGSGDPLVESRAIRFRLTIEAIVGPF